MEDQWALHVFTVSTKKVKQLLKLTLTGWSYSTPGPIILTSSETTSSNVAIVTSEGSNGINRSAVSRSSIVGNDSIH